MPKRDKWKWYRKQKHRLWKKGTSFAMQNAGHHRVSAAQELHLHKRENETKTTRTKKNINKHTRFGWENIKADMKKSGQKTVCILGWMAFYQMMKMNNVGAELCEWYLCETIPFRLLYFCNIWTLKYHMVVICLDSCTFSTTSSSTMPFFFARVHVFRNFVLSHRNIGEGGLRESNCTHVYVQLLEFISLMEIIAMTKTNC